MKKTLFLGMLLLLCVEANAARSKTVVASNIQLSPTEAIYNEALGLLKQQDYDNAILKFTASLSTDSTYYKAYYHRAIAYFETENYQRALADLNNAIRLIPESESAECYMLRAKTWHKMQNIPQARQDIDQAIALSGGKPAALLDKAAMMQEDEQYAEAIQTYSKVLEKDERNATALLERGNCYQYVGMLSNAYDDYSSVLRIQPDNLAAQLNEAVLTWTFKQDTLLALQKFTSLIEAHPKQAELYHARGLVYSHNQLYDAALDDFSEAARLRPNYAAAFNHRGCVYFKQQDYKQALIDFNRAIRINANYGEAYLNRAMANEWLRNADACCQDLKTAASLGVIEAESYYNRQCE